MKRILLATVAVASLTLLAGEGNAGLNDGAAPRLTVPANCGACFALVRSNGSLSPNSKGALTSSRLAIGTYDVRFRNSIAACAWSLTIGLDTFVNSVPARMITSAGRLGTTNGVFVQTFAPNGTSVDAPFHLVIHC